METAEVVVVGAGQAGLATGYHLARSGLSYVLLDAQEGPGGAWRQAWRSLRLFSPAPWSSLPGWMLPGTADEYPTRNQTLAYLAAYEQRYGLVVRRPVRAREVRAEDEAPDGHLVVMTDRGPWRTRVVVSATGTWERPSIPHVDGRDQFGGRELHSAQYTEPTPYRDLDVIIVGGGNSGAQILAEVSQIARTTWVTLEPPRFLLDHVDGRVLFASASERYRALTQGAAVAPPGGLGDIVMVEPVREARARGVLSAVRPFARFTPDGVAWPDGSTSHADVVIWCTGFRPALDHLKPLGAHETSGRIQVAGTRAVRVPRLWLVGYGDWTGFASATLIGVGRSARATVNEIVAYLAPPP